MVRCSNHVSKLVDYVSPEKEGYVYAVALYSSFDGVQLPCSSDYELSKRLQYIFCLLKYRNGFTRKLMNGLCFLLRL